MIVLFSAVALDGWAQGLVFAVLGLVAGHKDLSEAGVQAPYLQAEIDCHKGS